MFSSLSKSLANYITKDLHLEEDKNEVITYAIEMMLLTIIGFLAILLLGFVFNALLPAAIAAITGGLLRRVSGGAHFDTPLKCLSFGAIIYSFIGVLANNLWQIGFVNGINISLLLISLILVIVLAPVDSEEKPIHSQSLKRKLKFSSIIIVTLVLILTIFSNNLLINISATFGIFYQAITLLPIFNKREVI